jgi:hypothetical protein
MAVTMNRTREGDASDPARRAPEPGQPAALASARAARVGLLIGALGLGTSVFVVVRLFESWRVAPHGSSHHISIFGHMLSYPVANLDALVVLLLAAVGLVAVFMTAREAARAVLASRRLSRRLAEHDPQLLNGALLIDDPRPQAFCAGLLRPRVYVSTGAVALLDASALDAVLAHERHHARRRDPVRAAAAGVLARALFFVPGLGGIFQHQRALAELSADESAMNAAPENRSALARAMLTFADGPAAADGVGIDPARIDYLLGEPPSWRFPALLCLAAAGVIGLVAAVAVLAGQVAAGSATLAPPFLSNQPCVVVLALIPAVLVLVASRVARGVRRSYYTP